MSWRHLIHRFKVSWAYIYRRFSIEQSFLLYSWDAQCTFLLRPRDFSTMYIAGGTPTFPLNLIKRRLLPLRMVETRWYWGWNRKRAMDTAVCFLTETKRSKRGGAGSISRANGKRRMLDNYDEISPRMSRDTQSVLGTNGQVFPKIPRFSRRGLSAEWFCWLCGMALPRAAENVVNLISLETSPDEIVGPLWFIEWTPALPGSGRAMGVNLSDTHRCGAWCGVAIFLGCSYTAARENRIFMLTQTRPWDSPKLVRAAVGYLWTAVNKAL